MSCRICFDSDEEYPLLRACKCSGSIGHIHEHCLLTWLDTKQTDSCELCKTSYHITYNRPLESCTELNQLQTYFLVYPSWHLLCTCILQILLSKGLQINPTAAYLHAQILYQSVYASVNFGATLAIIKSPALYLQTLCKSGLGTYVLVHMTLWVYLILNKSMDVFIIVSITNQCYLGIYPILHHNVIRLLNQGRIRRLIPTKN